MSRRQPEQPQPPLMCGICQQPILPKQPWEVLPILTDQPPQAFHSACLNRLTHMILTILHRPDEPETPPTGC